MIYKVVLFNYLFFDRTLKLHIFNAINYWRTDLLESTPGDSFLVSEQIYYNKRQQPGDFDNWDRIMNMWLALYMVRFTKM